MFVPLLYHKPQNLVVGSKATRGFSGERNVIGSEKPEIRGFFLSILRDARFCSLLRMRTFKQPHPEEARSTVSKDAAPASP
jgi:hypothetical protein